MKEYFYLIGAFVISLNCAFAQKLPTGAYHANRERQYDILHYKAELAFDFEQRIVFGKATIRLAPLRQLERFALDAVKLNVKSVTQAEANTSLAFRSAGDSLIIILPQI